MKLKSLFLLVSLGFCLTCYSQIPNNDPHWEMVWKDDFDSFSNEKWIKVDSCDHSDNPSFAINKPLLLKENVYVDEENSYLVIKAHSTPAYCSGSGYTNVDQCGDCTQGWHNNQSGMILTRESFYFEQGYAEARIQCPAVMAALSGFWTWTNINPPWPYQEIDIVETQPGWDESYQGCSSIIHDNPHLMTASYHISDHGGCADGSTCCPENYDYTQWHVYGVEWSPSRIIWYLDGYPIRIYYNSLILSPAPIIFSLLKVGGGADNGIEFPENFSAYLNIDWVRVYRLKEDCDKFINSGQYDFSIYNNRLKNFIIIGGNGFYNALIPGQNITIRASQFIELNGDFSVPLGATFFADANDICKTDLGLNCTQTFNPCNTFVYDNSIKKIIELGGNGCNLIISPTSDNIQMKATDYCTIKPNVSLTPTTNKFLELKIVTCR